MSTPRIKRQFAGAASDPAQRQITSFFSSNGNNTSSPAARTYDSATIPTLPASVQANLLSVGLRVRKSVPEGYKTGTYAVKALWDEPTGSTSYTTAASAAAMGEGRSRANAISTPRELLPFCGINKVGGLSTQPETDTSSTSTYQPLTIADSMIDDYDDVPGLTSSQDTISSTDPHSFSTPSKTRKRSYTEDEDDRPETPDRRLNLNMNFNVWRDNYDDEVSPRSLGPTSWSPNNGGAGNGRVMAVPRKAKTRGGSKLATVAPRVLDQENFMVVDADGGSAGDFGEADFLVEYGDGRRSWEVEMSDA
ncbi:ribonucleotide reductase inhibitor-domain-containing protein [Hypoxylon trugodes]|uniref:ribonucleotide reductase inhibitor-domain-containing protein n=1 Tax=Hypoxylon trugodes TaxID=326681 RepID=UPI00218E3C9F|nr:ribonucleotide reductase inhibitor-domain-containing protein [Hypoxylon trugodes]KAI1392004.1 ribonucleotide reductase inhibitor-domain-containing protein [Hypoxylon trugodes]